MTKIVISYIPALHSGYIKFLKDHPGKLLILGPSLVGETPRMDRDIRALDPHAVKVMLQGLALMDDVHVIDTQEELKLHVNNSNDIILPDEEVNRNFAKKYLKSATLKPAFLRWDTKNSTNTFEPKANREVSIKQADLELMALAEAEATKSPDWWRQVGAVLAINGKPVLVGHNKPVIAPDYTFGAFGDPRSNFDAGKNIELSKVLHGESAIIAAAAKQGIKTNDASLYVTVFPCPVCAKLVAAAGIGKVYYHTGYSLLDAEDIFNAAGVELIKVEL